MRISVSVDGYKQAELQPVINAITAWLIKNKQVVVERDQYPDVEITLGGDGNTMKTVAACSPLNVPVLSINAGNVGFLTYGDIEDWEKALCELLNGRYAIEKRLGLELEYDGKKFGPFVNDVYFDCTRGVSYYTIWKNDILVHNKLMANGVIVSTPTGSTGYNQGAGGAICEPEVQSLLLITPICPTVFNTRPLIVSDKSIIKIEVAPCRKPNSALLFGDGQEIADIRDGGTILVKAHSVKLQFVVLEDSNFYLALQTKKGLRG